jgi:hypothetical protein
MTDTNIPAPINKTALTADKLIAAGDNAIVSVAEKLAIADQPWLATPIFKQIWQAVFGWFADKFTRAFQTGATFDIIDHQVDKEEKAMSPALAAVYAAEKSGDPNAIKAALKAYADANSALLHDDGSQSPTV